MTELAIAVAETPRRVHEAKLAVAEATERVQERQLTLLRAQRAVIDAQIEEATRKRDDAVRDILAAERALEPKPVIVNLLQPEHRPYAWRGRSGEIWRWDEEYRMFMWTYVHPAATVDKNLGKGAPFTRVGLVGDMAASGQ